MGIDTIIYGVLAVWVIPVIAGSLYLEQIQLDDSRIRTYHGDLYNLIHWMVLFPVVNYGFMICVVLILIKGKLLK